MGLRINETVAKKTPAPTSGRTIIQDDELAGFGLQVTAKGVRSFFIRYRINGRQLFYTIGQYPQWSAQAAREQAKTLKKHIDVGVDPLAKRRADVAATKKAAEPWLLMPLERSGG